MLGPDRRRRRLAALALGLAMAAGAGGCGLVPRSRLEDCRKQYQVLQAEADEWKDTAARLRGQNRDLVQRSIDDARRGRALEEANAQLQRTLAGYREDRDKMAAAYDQILRQVQVSTASPPAAALKDE